jgi:hypothetical protein
MTREFAGCYQVHETARSFGEVTAALENAFGSAPRINPSRSSIANRCCVSNGRKVFLSSQRTALSHQILG